MNMSEIIWSKYWSYRLFVKCRRNYVIIKDERDRDSEKRVKGEGQKERDTVRERETGQNIAKKIYKYYSFSIKNYKNLTTIF